MPKTYVPEFCRRLVDLARSGRPVKELVEEFGVSDASLYRWITQDQIDHGERSGIATCASKELVQARMRIRELESEIEVIREASRLFEGQSVAPKGYTR